MPSLGLGPNRGAAFGHEFAEAYLAQVGETLGALGLHAGDHSTGAPLPPGADPPPRGSALAARWRAGPLDPAGSVVDASDRPLLCMDVSADGRTAIVGGADHGLKEVGLGDAPRVHRELFSRTAGHAEWVTCVRALPDGRVLSGGVDAKLCLWAAAGRPARCADLSGHSGSVSQLRVSRSGAMALSASYDKTLRAWDLARSGAPAAVLRAHTAPVLELVWQGGLLASADRSGALVAWDLPTGRPAGAPVAAHRGHVTALVGAAGGGEGGEGEGARLVVSGGHDGAVRVWDVRAWAGGPSGAEARPALEARGAHTGAVNELCWHSLPSGAELLVSAGADGVLQLLEPRKGLRALAVCAEHRDHIYSLHCHGCLAFSGGGDGMLLAHDLASGACLYGLGANRAAVRCIRAAGESLLAAGDDGGLMVYRFAPGDGQPGRPPHRPGPAPARQRAPSPPLAQGALGRAGQPSAAAAPVGSAAAATEKARAYAEKRRGALEHAARLREQRRAQAAARGGAGGAGEGRGWKAPRGGPAPPQPGEEASEMDLLHAAGDAKFGRPNRRRA